MRRGAYVLSDAPNAAIPELILLASGSEVGLIVAAAERLQEQGIAVRCVSMPSWELFEALPQAERDAVLPPAVSARLAVEMGVPQGWDRYTGARGDMLSVERFGASAPAEVLLREYGFTVDTFARAPRRCWPSGNGIADPARHDFLWADSRVISPAQTGLHRRACSTPVPKRHCARQERSA